MENYDEFVDVDVDSIHSSERDSWDEELDDEESYSISNMNQSLVDGDHSADNGNDDGDAVGGNSQIRFDTITAEEIRSMEFATLNEAYDFITVMVSIMVLLLGKVIVGLRVKYKAEKDRYVVSAFEETHNHELTPARFVHLHPVYHKIFEVDKAQVDSLQKRGIRTCHIMGYMVAQKGGYADVGFTKKDLYNYFDKKMRAVIKDGDVAAALNYLNMKSSSDPMLYAEYAVDNVNGRMKTLFWADGISRTDYFCFGDVLAFDTTYRKNKYNYPLVVFSGCNHHSQTVIFGAALVSDETTETYKWVLRCFLECMEGKQPKAVVTDGDGAMREAIKQIFPDANHRLCAWHLNKNASENVKNGNNFLDGFSKAMYSNFTIDEFEEYWSQMIKENGVQGHPWVVKMYENRSLWATAYLRDNFFGRIRTTSQCEAVNAIIKSYVRKQGCIFEFMNNFDQALRDYRNNELVADFKSSSTDPVLSTQLPVIESHAGKIYTAELFKEVRHEILKAGELIVREKSEVGGRKTYILTKYCKDGYERSVVYDGSTFECSCKSKDDDAIGTQKSAVGDPVMVKCKGAPKKNNNVAKSGRRRSNGKNTTPNSKRCSGTQQTTEQVAEPNVDLYSVSISDSVSQIAEKRKRKEVCNVQRSVQNKTLYPPRYRAATVTTPAHMELQSSSRIMNQQLYPMMLIVHPMIQPMPLQPIYPMYGLQPGMQQGMQHGTNVGQSSCYGLLQHVMKSAKND
ncbi:unnamed protein product [Trifolium pratense]|uniref:Uncharacterized protein n=1 Tax=Trifolium pratense TaxID=57577 RepID=A0ACB0JK13_TRIPR|nr:unnamed protein product [Trifolium pratense]